MTIESVTRESGFRIEIEYDSEPQHPKEWDNLGTVAVTNRCRYNFGHESLSWEEIQRISRDKYFLVLPVYMYDHSGITINTTGFSCPWDSGLVGIIYCTKEKAVEEFGVKLCTAKVREKALNCMRGEIETLDQYLRGDVYGFEVYDPDDELVDSCYGFFGLDYCIEEATSVAEHYEANYPVQHDLFSKEAA